MLRQVKGRATLCVAIAGACLGIALGSVPAQATEYVDGISDQSISSWDSGFGGYFTGYFKNNWIASGHIKYARFVMPWYESSGGVDTDYRNWCSDAGGMGLTLDLSLTSYRKSEKRPTLAQYKAALKALLEQCSAIRIVEPWNEPDNGSEKSSEATVTYVNPAKAAEYAEEAASLCNTHSCATVVGDLLDSDANMVEYEENYVKALSGWKFPYWGIHPYLAVKEENSATVTRFEAHWGDGASALWFTEVGAYNCLDFGKVEVSGETSQGEHAKWLVRTLIHEFHPEHVFYYEFLDGDGHQPQTECEQNEGSPDTALYVPSSDPNASDRPRPAASWIFDDEGSPWGYTGVASGISPKAATLTGSLYSGGKLAASYHFEYWVTGGTAQYSAEGHVSANLGMAAASSSIEGLTPGASYHYRIVTWNSEGSTTGEERTFATPGPVEAVTGAASGIEQSQATLNGTVNPRGYGSEFYYEYWETAAERSYTKDRSAGEGASAVPEPEPITSLKSGTVYYYQLVAVSGGVTSDGGVQTFTTPAAPTPIVHSNNSQDVFFTGMNGGVGDLDHSTLWSLSEFGNLGSLVPSGSSSAVVDHSGVEDVFFTGTSGQIYEERLVGGVWSLADLGGSVAAAGSPSAVVLKEGALEVFFRATNGEVYVFWASSGGGPWTLVALGGDAAGDPTAKVYEANNTVQVYFVGANGALWTMWATNGTAPFGIGEVGGHPSVGTVSAFEEANGGQNVWFRGTNGSIWEEYWNPSNAQWTLSEIGGAAAGEPSGLIKSNGGADIFYRSTEATICELEIYALKITKNCLGGAATSDPTAVLENNGYQDVYFVGGGAVFGWFQGSEGWALGDLGAGGGLV
jgi:hypothetical protein